VGDEWLGEWWRPGDSTRVGGRLELGERGGPRLSMMGSLAAMPDLQVGEVRTYPLSQPLRIPVVYGLAPKAMSVLGAWCSIPRTPIMSGAEVWNAQAVVEAHIEPADRDPTFDGMSVGLPALAAWSKAVDLSVTYDWSGEGQTTVTFKRHSLATATLADETVIRIDQEPATNHGAREFTVRQPVRLTVRTPVESTWSDLLNGWVQPVQVLLWVASGQPGGVVDPMVRLEQEDIRNTGWARLRFSTIERSDEREVDAWDLLFTADELPGGFQAGIERWLQMWSEMKHILVPVFGRARAPFAYANDRFYTAVTGIEAHHRHRAESSRDLPKAQHKQRVNRIREIVHEHEPDLEEWAVNAVQEFNRIPLWRRIVEMANELPDIADALFGDSVEVFARAAEGARIGHAHALNRSLEIDDGVALSAAADALTWLLRASMLVDLGFNAASVQARVLKHHQFPWVANQTRDLVATLTEDDAEPVDDRQSSSNPRSANAAES
jgi:ApeA N-terminal domain 1